MKNKFKLDIILLIAALLIAYTSTATAFPSQTNACNGGAGCHALSTAIQVSGDVTSTLTVNPGQPFTLNISWSGGSTTRDTVAKWPSNFTNIGITRDNLLFNPVPIASPTGVNPSGTLLSTLTAPAATGPYTVRVYASTADPFITNFMDINISVQPVTQPQTFSISGFKLRSTDNSGVPDWSITLTNDTMNTTATTDATGMYQFTGLSNGTYNVTEGSMTGWTPMGATTLPVTIAGADVMNKNFTNTPPPVTQPQTFNISGFKLKSTDNSGVPGWTMTLTNDTMNINATTDATGMYQFTGLSNGAYNVTEGSMTGWTPMGATTIPVTIQDADVQNVNFINTPPVTQPQTFNISGFKLKSTDNSGVSGWTMTLTNDTMNINATTDATGMYQFTDLSNGAYNVTEGSMTGWTPVGATTLPVTIQDADVQNVNFINTPPVTQLQTFNISGFKLRSTDNTGVPDWPITLTNDTMTTTVTTGATGMYQFTGLSNGTYNVTEGTMTGWTPVGATTLSVTIAGADVMNKNFTNTPPVPTPTEKGSISGLKINDINGNGKQDSGEDGLSGWTIELRGIGPETHKIERVATTDSNGFYKFDDLPAGKYIVKEKHMKGFIPVSPPVIVVSLEKGMDSTDNNFMNRPISSLTKRGDDDTE